MTMTREKKKLTYQDLEQHVVYWAVDQLEDLREVAHRIYLDLSIHDEEKELIYGGLARQAFHLLELLIPLRHDEETLIEWANDFIDEYETYDKDSCEG